MGILPNIEAVSTSAFVGQLECDGWLRWQALTIDKYPSGSSLVCDLVQVALCVRVCVCACVCLCKVSQVSMDLIMKTPHKARHIVLLLVAKSFIVRDDASVQDQVLAGLFLRSQWCKKMRGQLCDFFTRCPRSSLPLWPAATQPKFTIGA